jgi:hypothetical protein
MIGPGCFQPVRHHFYRSRALGAQYQKANRRCAESTNQEQYVSHCTSLPHGTQPMGDWMHEETDRFSQGCALAGIAPNSYTFGMDRVRFGRALGMGARYAAKTLVSAADAATAPNPKTTPSRTAPSGPAVRTQPQQAQSASHSDATLGQKAARTTAQVRRTKENLSRGGKRFGEAAWAPFVKLSGVLWLEVTGVFFGLFVIVAVSNTWKLLAKQHSFGLSHVEDRYLFFSIAMAAIFGYFCISSFVRASRRQHRR